MIARLTGHEAESGMTCVDIAMTCPLNPRAVDPRASGKKVTQEQADSAARDFACKSRDVRDNSKDRDDFER